MDQWTKGPMDQKTYGSMDQALDQFIAMDKWTNGQETLVILWKEKHIGTSALKKSLFLGLCS